MECVRSNGSPPSLVSVLFANPLAGEDAKRIARVVYYKESKLNFMIDHKVVNWLKKTLMEYSVVVE